MLCPHCDHEQPDDNYIGLARCDKCSRAFSVNHSEGRSFLQEGRLSEAIEKLELASLFMKNTALVFLDLARAFALNNQMEEMKKALERAYEIDSEFVIENWLRDLSLPDIDKKNEYERSLDNLISLAEETIKNS